MFDKGDHFGLYCGNHDGRLPMKVQGKILNWGANIEFHDCNLRSVNGLYRMMYYDAKQSLKKEHVRDHRSHLIKNDYHQATKFN